MKDVHKKEEAVLRLFVGGGEDGIDTAVFMPEKAMRLESAARDGKVMYMQAQGRCIYALLMGGEESMLAVYRMDTRGTLERLTQILGTGGKEACHLCISPCGKYLYCANYMSGTISEFRIPQEEGVSPVRTQLIKHCGHSVNALRQEAAHPHMVCFTPDGAFLCVVDLGTDRIVLYPFSSQKGIDALRAEVCPLPAGVGPRHMIFDGMQRAWVIAELEPLLLQLRYVKGKLTFEKSVALTAAHTSGAAIRLAPGGKTLYLSHRGNHSVTRLSLADETFETMEAEGISPRDVNLTPDGRFAVCANEGGALAVLALEEARMRKVGEIPCKGSNCVIFV